MSDAAPPKTPIRRTQFVRIVRCCAGKEGEEFALSDIARSEPVYSTPHRAVAMLERHDQMAGLGAFCPDRNVFLRTISHSQGLIRTTTPVIPRP
jgi:hypothetical protein